MDQNTQAAADLQGRSAILFDFDGTVFDTVEGITKSIQHAIRKHGMDAELEELRCFAGPPLVDKFMEVFGVPDAEAEQLVVDFRERYAPIGVYESEPFPGIHDLLAALRRAWKTLGVATSKPQNMAELLLERSGLLDCFDVIVGSDPKLNNNAKWEVVTRAMERCGATPECTVLIGDTKYDVAGARRCGIPCVGVRWGYASEGEMEEAGAAAMVETMEDLLALLCAETD
ncbi:MAG: HAD hydrolase-like protein [Oscillospiraceae bacterium]|nr:HAD hydrolase-like protein [Oscillospiraceae bacterium]